MDNRPFLEYFEGDMNGKHIHTRDTANDMQKELDKLSRELDKVEEDYFMGLPEGKVKSIEAIRRLRQEKLEVEQQLKHEMAVVEKITSTIKYIVTLIALVLVAVLATAVSYR